ncbi:[Wnt protein] O-palmitoleoyl-L-serine hydrolase [Salvia divinorum]|uniref:Pectin acetylesterase n=1 Tax=Salvia divinorum TaxID=28513 RepID=A0ABD1GDT2_SALDI
MGNNSQVTVAAWLKVLFYLLFFVQSQVKGQFIEPIINVTYIEDGVAKGAVCLDGSPGAYHFGQGFEDGIDNWVIYLPGGAWCDSKDDCLIRSNDSYSGNTRHAIPKPLFGFLSEDKSLNSDFYNWNKVYIRYCDGASFLADVEAADPVTKLYQRGRRIFGSVLEELITTKGMSNAVNALLTGNSAGGLATILNCDRFRSFLPDACRVKCVSDSGFFIRGKDLPGAYDRAIDYFGRVVNYHKLAKYLPESCTRRLAPELCFFAENVVDDIEAPLYLLNSNFDRYQISRLVVPNPPTNEGWADCTKNFSSLKRCTADQLHLMKDFQNVFLKTLEGLNDNPSRGLFIISCFIHDISPRVQHAPNWQGTTILQNKAVLQIVGDWYFERSNVRFIDNQHSYPTNCSLAK